ncbi:MAG: HAD family hydrolase [Ignavibacteriales bacterium]
MFQVKVPGVGEFKLNNLVLDMNGTITTDGQLNTGVKWRINKLKDSFNIYLLTSDTFGTAKIAAAELGIELQVVNSEYGGPQKKDIVKNLGAAETVAIGNGSNDVLMLQEAGVSVAVLGGEGSSAKALQAAMLVVKDIRDALDLFLDERRFIAALRA